ncbi:MAG: shikimate kinase [Ferrimicrobium sp.]
MRRIVLCGPTGVGKSSVGALIARYTGGLALDLDTEIEASVGVSIADYVAKSGMPAFREREAEVLVTALDQEDWQVLMAGGGSLLDSTTRARLRSRECVVWLDASTSVLLHRLDLGAKRPVLPVVTVEAIEALVAQRSSGFQEVARVRIGTSRLTSEEVASIAVSLMEVL